MASGFILLCFFSVDFVVVEEALTAPPRELPGSLEAVSRGGVKLRSCYLLITPTRLQVQQVQKARRRAACAIAPSRDFSGIGAPA